MVLVEARVETRMLWFGTNKATIFPVLALVVAFAGGCGGSTPEASTPASAATVAAPTIDLSKRVDAGIDVKQGSDPKEIKSWVRVAALKAGPARPDPFALKAQEKAFEAEQGSERLLGELGGYRNEFAPTEPKEDAPLPTPEPQPYRRLAGVVVGDSVLALIDMGNGNTYLVHPGEKVPESEWTVASIDMDKAVLKRGGNLLPHEIVVRLELPPANLSSATAVPGGNGSGNGPRISGAGGGGVGAGG